MKDRNQEHENLLHCKNCDGYYDPSLPNCPHCGEDTANNVNNESSSGSVTQYGGGFGEAGSTLSRVALLMVTVLGVVALLTIAVMGVRLLPAGLSAMTSPAETSAPAEPAEESTPAQQSVQPAESAPAKEETPSKKEETKPQEPAQLPPSAIRLDFYDLTLVNDGESHQFKVTVEPSDWEGDLTWTTDNQSVAVVSADGKVTSVGKGECNVTVSAGDISYRCIIRCKSGSAAGEGGSASVTSHYADGKLSEAGAEQKDSDEQKKAKQAEKEKKKKEAEEKKKAEEEKQQQEEEKKKKAEEEEKKKEEEERKKKEEEEKKQQEEEENGSITLQYYDITLVHVGEGYQFSPSGGSGSYSWSSANSGVASVDSSGYVKATGVGQTTITCTSGNTSVDVVVRVKSN